MNEKPNFCHCGERLIEQVSYTTHDIYTGKEFAVTYLACPKRGKWFQGEHDRWDLHDGTWLKYSDWQL